jgi:enoyl-CoA hydratase/carnithine racemase
VGVRKAKEILYENTFMTAQEAMQWGFVNRIYPAADLEKETLKYASRVVETGQFYCRTIKFAINQAQDMSGFSTSVRSIGEYFIRTDPTQTPAGGEPGARLHSRFRNLSSRAIQYLEEDRGKKGNTE